jgi:hypothetical protein
VVEGEVPHLPLDPAAIDRGRPVGRAERGHDSGNRRVAEVEPGDLSQDGQLPGRIGQSRPAAQASHGSG